MTLIRALLSIQHTQTCTNLDCIGEYEFIGTTFRKCEVCKSLKQSPSNGDNNTNYTIKHKSKL